MFYLVMLFQSNAWILLLLQFHLKDGVTISEVQADNIFDSKKNKPALAVKEIAQALWGSELLAQRTYGGKVAPKDRNNPDAKPRKELSPDKVSLVISENTLSMLPCISEYIYDGHTTFQEHSATEEWRRRLMWLRHLQTSRPYPR